MKKYLKNKIKEIFILIIGILLFILTIKSALS